MALESSVSISTIPIPMGEPHHADVSLFSNIVHGKANIPKIAFVTLHISLTFTGKVMACSSVGSLYYKRIYLLYLVVKEQSAYLPSKDHNVLILWALIDK